MFTERALYYTTNGKKKILDAYIGQLSTHLLPNTFIKINNNIFHGTCFQPSLKILPCSCFFSNTNMFLRKNNILNENRLVKEAYAF